MNIRPSSTLRGLREIGALACLSMLTSCAMVGPDFAPLEPGADGQDSFAVTEGLEPAAEVPERWWEIFDDPIVNHVVDEARQQNLSLETAALRVLEARARVDIATGLSYPQTQVIAGGATFTNPPASDILSVLGNDGFWSYSLGATVSWEIDFWGRYRRGIEAAGAAYNASIAAYDEAVVLLTSQVVSTYATVREIEEQISSSRSNVELQQRSYEITKTLYRNGESSELDMQQALSLLLSTQATIPSLEASLQQSKNALSSLLGKPPGYVDEMLSTGNGVPAVPVDLAVGMPADMLRRRPDVRQAELLAMAQNARVGLATANLYPSFALSGILATSAGGLADAPLGNLFSGDSIGLSAGANFVWPFLNYGRIKSNIRVEDARLQQALLNYRQVVIQAAREANDAMAALAGARAQDRILTNAVQSAARSNELSLLRFSEGFSDYQRVLDAQQRLFSQQQRYVSNRAAIVRNTVNLYKALGGGWQDRSGMPLPNPETLEKMKSRTDWGELLGNDTD
jgi:NodT family efflux transporter outer membrane factor (OMF) lipoprotein